MIRWLLLSLPVVGWAVLLPPPAAVAADVAAGRAVVVGGEEASVTLLGHHRTVRQAKQTAAFETREVGSCLGWDPFLPSPRSPWDEAWLEGCGDVVFRLGRIVARIHTFTNDVRIDSAANGRRTTKLAKIAARRLGRLRCPRVFCP